MNVAENQARNFLQLLGKLRPHWRRDPALPRRIQSLLTGERRFGSRDRRLYRELVYTTLRYLPWIEPLLDHDAGEAIRRMAWLAAETPATKAFCATFARGEPPAGDRTELLPAWFRDHCPEIFSGAELDAQLRRASLWLRLQTDDAGTAKVLGEFSNRAWQWRRSSVLPDAVELLSEADVTQTDAWHDGRVEVQDLGSQMILASIGLARGERWLDACAGAGGKSLQLARLLGPAGHVDAHDVRADALEELRTRATRAGMIVAAVCDGRSGEPGGHRPPLQDEPGGHGPPLQGEPGGHGPPLQGHAAITLRPGRVADNVAYDGVLVDAPCSGSGTWRRFPHLKWSITPDLVAQRAALQQKLLADFAPRVRPGGRLVYATCSLSRCENEDVVAAFLADHSDFRPEPFAATFGFAVRGNGLTILPSRHDTDGFFVASLRRA